jgi:Glycosyl hydrolases family 43/F5/8 type C domain
MTGGIAMKIMTHKTMTLGFLVLGLILGTLMPAEAKWLTLHNDFFMYDLDGNKINTRSGAMRKFGDTYYWYGSANRFTDQTCYSSKDLLHWTYRGVALKAASTNRVDVVYNESTKKYVMFLKTGPSDGTELGIATSSVPEGPFTLIGNSLVFGHKMGDMSVYQDDDGQAYLAYVWDSIPGANSGGVSQHALARLAPDYLTVEKRLWLWNRGSREANMVMKRNGLYYYLTSLTLWTESTPTQYYTARNIEGPWTNQLVPMMVPGNTANNSWDTQCDFVFPFKGPKDTVQMYVGDRWEKPDPARLGDYVFLPLSFTSKDSVVANYYQDWEVEPDLGLWRPIDDARNLALSKSATASSSGGGTVPGNVTAPKTWRNYSNTKWTSGATDNEWIQIDLGSSKEINRVILKWDSSYAKAFKVQTSVDAAAWSDVYSTTTGAARSVTDETFATTQARYVRMLGVTRGTTQGYSLYQFMVLNDSLPPVTAMRSAKTSPKSSSLLTYEDNLVRYTLPVDQNVKLELWTAQGRLVSTLDAGYKLAGAHHMSLPNISLSSGTYILKLSIGAKSASRLKIRLGGR